MSIKIKVVLTCLVLITAISAYQFLHSFNTPDGSSNLAGSTLQEVSSDSDGDGLIDTDESVWNTDLNNKDTDGDGFLDGEEVASGHDPLIPGPKDSLTEQNITEKLTDLVVAGLYTENLKPKKDDPITYESSLNDLALASIQDFYQSTPLKENPAPILVDATKENQQAYLNFIGRSIQEQLLDYPSTLTPGSISSEDYYLQKSIRFRTVGEQLKKQGVPKNWQILHEQILNSFQRLAIDYKAIADKETDPMKALVAANEVSSIIEPQIRSIIETVNGEIIKNKLVLESTFYNVVGQIY